MLTDMYNSNRNVRHMLSNIKTNYKKGSCIMKKNTKRIITATGIAAGTAAVASLSAYVTTKALIDTALDREMPKVMKNANKRISGEKSSGEYTAYLENSSRRLAEQPNEIVKITAHDGETLVGHYFPCENPERVIIAFHGWRSSWHRDFGMISDFWHRSNCSVLYVEQRGQNNSGGKHMGFGLTERYDCLDWLKWETERCGSCIPVYLAGISMGAATVLMASGLQLPQNVHGIMADCGFTSANAIWEHIAKDNLHIRFRVRSAIADMMCRRKINVGSKEYSTTDALKHTNVPVIFIHGSDDNFVPVNMTYENYMACASPKELLIVPGADHCMSYFMEKEKYENAVKAFWAKYDKSAREA